jgi:ribonuclease HII
VARHHADRDDVVVGAASIVAKVRRDRAIARLQQALGEDLGSGYPSDPRTVEFLRARLAVDPKPPAWVRASWATMQRVKPARPAPTLETFER